MRFSIIISIAIVFLTATNSSARQPEEQSSSTDSLLVTVNIDRIGHKKLTALKAQAGIAWWVEIDDVLLTAVEPAFTKPLQNHYDTMLISTISDPNRIKFAHNVSADTLKALPADILVHRGRLAVIRMVGKAAGNFETIGRIPETGMLISPFLPNSVLARQAVNEPDLTLRIFSEGVRQMVDEVNGNRWFADVEKLASWNRYSYHSGNGEARLWLVDQFNSLPGLEVSTHEFALGSTPAHNVVATLEGTERPNDIYIVGAHYDSTSNNTSQAAPGAEDNASGTAGVLEIARIFATNPPAATVIFIAFGGEEQGLRGSKAWVSWLKQNFSASQVKAVLTMDMIGYTGDDDLDCLLETSSSYSWMQDDLAAAAVGFTSLRIVKTFNYWGSDHVPFIDAGMPGLLVIENDEGSYPYYHKTGDLPRNITIDMGLEILKMNVATLAQWTM